MPARRRSTSDDSDSTEDTGTDTSGGSTSDSSGKDDVFSSNDDSPLETSQDLDQTLSSVKESAQKKQIPPREHSEKRTRRYQLTTSMFKEYPIIKAYATGPKNADKNPHKWYCRICHKNYSLKTRGGGGILKHFKSSRHFRRDQRYRDSQKMPVYDRTGTVVVGDALEAERLGFMAVKNPPTLDSKRLLVGQKRIPISGDDVGTNNILKSQISLYSEFLTRDAPLTVVPGLWGRFGLVTDHSSLVSNYSWDNPQVFVSCFQL